MAHVFSQFVIHKPQCVNKGETMIYLYGQGRRKRRREARQDIIFSANDAISNIVNIQDSSIVILVLKYFPKKIFSNDKY